MLWQAAGPLDGLLALPVNTCLLQEFLEGVDMSTFGIAMGSVRLHRILHSNVQELLGDSLMEAK